MGETASLKPIDREAAHDPEPAAEPRSKFRSLDPAHMPRDYSVSLDAYRRGGTDAFLGPQAPRHLVAQPMKGFEPTYVNIVDYIVRITHRIWEEKDIGYIYDTYSHDCCVWDDFGLQYGRDRIVADTIQMNNGFPDIRIVSDEVIWAGDEERGFHTSHRTRIFGANTGFTRFGPPTGRRVQFWCMANCVARDNEIYQEHVVYDTTALIQQLGLDVIETARRMADRVGSAALPENFGGSESKRLTGQGKPESVPFPPAPSEDVDAFARAVFSTVWNRRNLAAIGDVYSPSALIQATAGRVYRSPGQLQSFVLSMLAMFPDLNMTVDDIYWMGAAAEGQLVAIRWSLTATHSGPGRYGDPTGREVSIWGVTHWVLDKGRIQQEWFMFNEFGLLMQIFGG